ITGPSTPITLLRVATEISSASETNPSVGRSAIDQPSSTSASEWPGGSRVPERPTSGCVPITSAPAARLLSARAQTMSTAHVAAASVLPTKISPRLQERVSKSFHVSWRSSPANTSPATRPARTGKPQEPAKPRTTSGSAKPDVCTQRPKSVSAGTAPCAFRTPATANGARTTTAATTRVGNWPASLLSSTRTTWAAPGGLTSTSTKVSKETDDDV